MKSKHLFAKSLLILLVLSLLLPCLLAGCAEKDRTYDEAEVLAAAKELIEGSILLNEIYYGRGIPYLDDASEANGYYYPADPFFEDESGIGSIADLRERTDAVYTRALADLIYRTKLSSVSDEDGVRALARYYQKYEDAEQTQPVCIMVNVRAEVFLVDEVEYLFDTLSVDGAEGERVYVRMLTRATDGEGHTLESVMRVALIEEERGWRLDSPTYRRYHAEGGE